MALPQKIQVNAITGASLPSLIDNDINAGLKTPLIDILGIPDNTNVSNAVMEVVADGLKNLRLRDASANPANAGYLQRNGTLLNFYDGGANRVLVSRDLAETLTNKTITAPVLSGTATGTYTVGAQRIVVGIDVGNSTPAITVETGATAFDNKWVQTTPTPTSQGGSFTTVASTLRILRRGVFPTTSVLVQGSVIVTTAGTATGYIRVPLPFTVAAASHGAVFMVRETNTGVSGAGFVAAGSANLDLVKYDAATLIADTRTILFSGELEITP